MDLLYEELPGARADEAQAHMERCASCKTAFSQLRQALDLAEQLPLPEPSPHVTESILAAARAQLDGEAERPATGDEADEGLWASILRFLGSFAMGPQVAMATVMLLVVAIGLWYVPTSERQQDAVGETVVDPEHGGEAGATILPEGVEPPPPEPPSIARPEPQQPYETTRGARPQEPLLRDHEVAAARPARDPAIADVRDGTAEGEGDAIEGAVEPPPPVVAVAGGARGQSRAGQLRTEGSTPAGETVSTPMAPPSAAPAPPSPTALPTTSAASNADAVAQQQAVASGNRADYDRGMQEYRRGDFDSAIRDLGEVVTRPEETARPLVPSALHHLARSYRGNARYPQAAQQYERLLTRFPTYSGAGQAMLELAETYRRMGRLGEAERWLHRASQNPLLAATAQRELRRIATQREAQERAAAQPAPARQRRAAPSAPSPAPEQREAPAYDSAEASDF